MKPVQVSIDLPQTREVVYDFLDVLANHELFTGHMFHDWEYDGPARGVGAKATVTTYTGGRTEPIDIEVTESERPLRSVERSVGASGRITTGTYTLAELPGGGTRVTFENAWIRVPRREVPATPLIRALVRRNNKQAMEGLAEQLLAREERRASRGARGRRRH
jgi:hypothetical protein